jgi:hypothetical protein
MSDSLLSQILTYVQIIQGIVAVVAIVAGAWWFYARRASVRKANVSHEVMFAGLGKDVYVAVRVTIKNTGNRRISTEDHRAKAAGGEELLSNIVTIEEVSPYLGKQEPVSQKFSPEYEMLFLGSRAFPDTIIVEPKEEQAILFEFIIPKTTKAIKVYSHMDNVYTENTGWDTTTIHPVTNM